MFHHLGDVYRPAREQFFKGAALFGSLRMQWESRPSDADGIFVLQFLNTPGNEITPGSDIV